jgi:hypothetical protein
MPDAPKFTPPAAGPEHAVFEKDVGTWDAEIVIRMPGAPPQESKGVAVNRLVADRMWLVSDFKNETTGFEGHGVFGYDPHKKKYVGTWARTRRSTWVPGSIRCARRSTRWKARGTRRRAR